jgi:hypothetical protein
VEVRMCVCLNMCAVCCDVHSSVRMSGCLLSCPC